MQRQSERSLVLETVEVPISAIAGTALEEDYLPELELIIDGELKKMGAVGASELGRRKKQRAAHVKAKRVRYVRETEGYNNSSLWISSPDSKLDRKKSKYRPNGEWNGTVGDTPSDAIWTALRQLEYRDEGGVIYVTKYWDRPASVIDVRPSPCEALAKTGKHDWFYVPTGDDICRSCGLLV